MAHVSSTASALLGDTLSVDGVLSSLATVRAFITTVAERASLGRRAAYGLRLAVDEIATNIITHGYAGAVIPGTIVVQATYLDQGVTVTIEDTGAGYAPEPIDPDSLDLPPELRPEGGLGILLASRSVDELHYEQLEHCNRHTLVVHRKTSP